LALQLRFLRFALVGEGDHNFVLVFADSLQFTTVAAHLSQLPFQLRCLVLVGLYRGCIGLIVHNNVSTEPDELLAFVMGVSGKRRWRLGV